MTPAAGIRRHGVNAMSRSARSLEELRTHTGLVLSQMVERHPCLASCQDDVREVISILLASWRSGCRLLLCGNGGSAADCDHIVGELAKGFLLPRPLPLADKSRLRLAGPEGELIACTLQGGLPAISLAAHPAFYTAYCNDVEAEFAFAQQVYVHGRPGDCLLAISTSGESRNVLLAAITAKSFGLRVAALTGCRGGAISRLADASIRVPAESTAEVQELHIIVYHTICAAIEAEWFSPR